MLITLRDAKEHEDKELAFRAFDHILRKQRIGFITPKIEAYETSIKVIRVDSRVEQTDALHYSLAVQENANAFVTFDKKMTGNKTLEMEFGVKIIHPENL